MGLMPRTGMHHSLAVMWFALDCLIADIRHHRKAKP